MKQGQASHSSTGATKVEPVSKAVSPGAVSQIGGAQGRMANIKPLYEGRGLQAPMAKCTTHPKGSQR
jgi:hypothetical protein